MDPVVQAILSLRVPQESIPAECRMLLVSLYARLDGPNLIYSEFQGLGPRLAEGFVAESL